MNEPPAGGADPGPSDSADLTVRLRQLELVADFGIFALRQNDVDATLQQACALSASGLQTRFAKVLTYQPTSSDFLVSHGVGWHDGVVGHARIGGDLNSPAGYAVHTKEPVISTHLAQETRFRTPSLLVEHNVHRAINVIIGEDTSNPFGVLEADSTDRTAFTKEDSAFLQALANVVFAAIQRRRDQDAQAQLLREKDILMQEVHHRTKNSLQIVQTMLHLQARSIPDGEEKSRLQDAASRIMTIAAVHRHLHDEGAVELVDMPGYMAGLLADIGKSLGPTDGSRPISLEVDPMVLPPQHATPVGLIAAELVTNALKYGAGAISLRITCTDNDVLITSQDAGLGFEPGFDVATSRSLGMRLMVALARNTNPITIAHDDGTTSVTVRVALPEHAAPG